MLRSGGVLAVFDDHLRQARGVDMSDAGLTALADGVRVSASMTNIDVSGAGVTARGLGDLWEALRACK